MFTLEELTTATGGSIAGHKSCHRVSSISTDSRTISKGQAFCAIVGKISTATILFPRR